jgi:hypothetical protein
MLLNNKIFYVIGLKFSPQNQTSCIVLSVPMHGAALSWADPATAGLMRARQEMQDPRDFSWREARNMLSSLIKSSAGDACVVVSPRYFSHHAAIATCRPVADHLKRLSLPADPVLHDDPVKSMRIEIQITVRTHARACQV